MLNLEFIAIYTALFILAMGIPACAAIIMRLAVGTWNPVRGAARAASMFATDMARILRAACERLDSLAQSAETAADVRRSYTRVDVPSVTRVNAHAAAIVAAANDSHTLGNARTLPLDGVPVERTEAVPMWTELPNGTILYNRV